MMTASQLAEAAGFPDRAIFQMDALNSDLNHVAIWRGMERMGLGEGHAVTVVCGQWRRIHLRQIRNSLPENIGLAMITVEGAQEEWLLIGPTKVSFFSHGNA